MTTPTPIPHLDEPAQLRTQIRKLQAKLEESEAKVERYLRSNGSLALELHGVRARLQTIENEQIAALSANGIDELHEARELAKALAAEVEQLRAARSSHGPLADDTSISDAIRHIEGGGVLEFNDGTSQHRLKNGRHEYRNRGPSAAYWTEWRDSDLRHMVDKPGFYTLLPQENGAAG